MTISVPFQNCKNVTSQSFFGSLAEKWVEDLAMERLKHPAKEGLKHVKWSTPKYGNQNEQKSEDSHFKQTNKVSGFRKVAIIGSAVALMLSI